MQVASNRKKYNVTPTREKKPEPVRTKSSTHITSKLTVRCSSFGKLRAFWKYLTIQKILFMSMTSWLEENYRIVSILKCWLACLFIGRSFLYLHVWVHRSSSRNSTVIHTFVRAINTCIFMRNVSALTVSRQGLERIRVTMIFIESM